MSKELIRKKVKLLVKKYDTTDPYELCARLGISIYHKDLGKNIMGMRTLLNRVPIFLLSDRNSENENAITCRHELGHHICGHKSNADKLTKDNMRFIAQGNEFEANFFMVELLLYNINLADFPTKQALLDRCGIPMWAERYVDWEYLKENTDFNSFNSYY